jgi:molybdopterin/thiamine biosynthesis adenylyltransferase
VALTNRQIERYSRQIIVDKFGGVAQERLLASRVLLIANHIDAETVLAYLVGAGVGNIYLHANLDIAARDMITKRMRDLNSDSAVVVGDPGAADMTDVDLAIAIVSDDATLARLRSICGNASKIALVLARLDLPAKLAVIPSRPPCLRCANAGELLASTGSRIENVGFVAMLATLEAIKLLTRYDPAPQPTLIEFNSYQPSRRTLVPSAGIACGCRSVQESKAIE